MIKSNISNNYCEMINAFCKRSNSNISLDSKELSKALFYDIFKIKEAQWKFRIEFGRLKKHGFSDTFQDLVAFYLKMALGDDYRIVLEKRRNKIQPDLLIYKNDKEHFVIEIKTTIGWNRKGPEMEYENRINRISREFNVDNKNVIYVLLNPYNAGKEFLFKYLNENYIPKHERPTGFPYNQIYPLFVNDDPYYNNQKKMNVNSNYIITKDSSVIEMAEYSIVSRIEDIVKMIKGGVNV